MIPTPPHRAIIVAHGQPSNPAPAEADLARLAARVGKLMAGWTLGSATLATPNALKLAVHALPGAVVFPMFMSDGWFTNTTLPEHLAAAGAHVNGILAPFGHNALLPRLAACATRAAVLKLGVQTHDTTLILAAHGASRNPAAGRSAHRLATGISRFASFHDMRIGFLEEPPFLDQIAQVSADRPALCLPLFAAGGVHVTQDIPAALDAAKFRGLLLAPIGQDEAVPALIAAALRHAPMTK